VVVGVSLGGQVALELYRRRPDLVAALALSGTVAAGETAQGRRARRENAERLAAAGMAGHTHRALPTMVAAGADPAAVALVGTMMLETPPDGAAATQRGRADRADLRSLLPRIAVPTLVLVGDDDPYVPVAQARLMRACIPGARLRVVAGAGHLPSVEKPAETTAVLQEHLDQAFLLSR
ncbi:alpha/beta fold hydrolase, partial [Pseudonocardia ailaonensis]|uniref:alpha/beta fold hydrolase n=1 Tax=Pseudonocardia ailaonensis TaxID=367279 RepID=UPI0031E0D50D